MQRRQPLPLTWTCNSLFHLKVFHIKCLTTAAPAVHWITKIYTCTVDVRSIWHQLFCIVIHQALDRASHLSKRSSVDRFPGYWSACQSILKQDVRVCNWDKILGIEKLLIWICVIGWMSLVRKNALSAQRRKASTLYGSILSEPRDLPAGQTHRQTSFCIKTSQDIHTHVYI